MMQPYTGVLPADTFLDWLAIVNLLLALGGATLNYIYFRRSRQVWRWLKLMYAIDMTLVAILESFVVFDGGNPLFIGRLVVSLILTALLAGTISSFGRLNK